MDFFYTDERNIQQIIYLLKAHGIKKIVANPGSSNVSFVASIQHDSFFEVYSVVDERSAAYFACGLAEESNEPVVLTCTGATSSRDYLPGMTEAYYRKLPVIAITALMHPGYIGQNKPQVMDRRVVLNDVVKYSAQIDIVNTPDDEWANEVKINTALLELRHNGGGPVHLNMVTTFSPNFSVKELPVSRAIFKVRNKDTFPELYGKSVAIFVGAHKKWSKELTLAVDQFCEKYNAVVYGDHTSNYQGKYYVLANLISNQQRYNSQCLSIDVLIDIGNISGAYINIEAKEIWRVNEDGMIRDNRKKQSLVFEMEEIDFFEGYNKLSSDSNVTNYKLAKAEYDRIYKKINGNELDFSNIWVAYMLAPKLKKNSTIHFAILNSLRAWNFFEFDISITGYSNTGGFGIDGCTSSLIGASVVDSNKTYYFVTGDLAFFYDLNMIANRHIGNNIRVLLINNGLGTEFKNYTCTASKFESDTDTFISAAGHNGNKSRELVKLFVKELGFEYISASSKKEFNQVYESFLCEKSDKPILFEVFTDSASENKALYYINNLEVSASGYTKSIMKSFAKGILGDSGAETLKKKLKG